MNQNLSLAARNWNAIYVLFCGTSRDNGLQTDAHPYEKVDHEENVESEIDLLGQVFAPRNAFFHALAALDERVVNIWGHIDAWRTPTPTHLEASMK